MTVLQITGLRAGTTRFPSYDGAVLGLEDILVSRHVEPRPRINCPGYRIAVYEINEENRMLLARRRSVS